MKTTFFNGFSKKAKDRAFIIAMLALPILNFFVFYLYVNFDSILLAFQVPRGDEMKWSLQNFNMLFDEFGSSSSELSTALLNTMKYFFSGLLITLPISFCLCYFLYKKIRWYKGFRVIFYLPNIISASVLAVLFRYMIAVNGPVSELMQTVGMKPIEPVFNMSKYATNTIVLYTIFFGLGGNLILFSGAMSNIDESVVEAAKIDGAGMWTEMLKIVIPLIWPTLSTVLIFNFIGVFSASGPILLFTKGAFNTYTISYWIYDKVAFGNQLNYPSAVGLFFTLIGAPIALFMRWLLTKPFDTGE